MLCRLTIFSNVFCMPSSGTGDDKVVIGDPALYSSEGFHKQIRPFNRIEPANIKQIGGIAEMKHLSEGGGHRVTHTGLVKRRWE